MKEVTGVNWVFESSSFLRIQASDQKTFLTLISLSPFLESPPTALALVLLSFFSFSAFATLICLTKKAVQ